MASTATSPRRLPSDPPQPDLSHLTEEERQIIESVLERQKAEAARDQHVISNLENDVKRLEANIKKQVQRTGDSGVPMTSTADGDTCRICNKVKFAGTSGYTCHYCQLKSCTRCGGKLTLKAKAIWACNLCRKKQELALKSGQWYHGMRPAGAERKGSLVRQSSMSSDIDTSPHRRSREMRIHGAAKRSSSAHALMETDQMDENGNHSRMNLRKSNGDVSHTGRLRGELETTPFIIPKWQPSASTSRQSSIEAVSPARSPTRSSAGGKFIGSPTAFPHTKDEVLTPQIKMLPNHMQERAKAMTVDAYESYGQVSSGSSPADRNRGGHWLAPSSDKLHPGSDTGSTMRESASSTSSRHSDGSRKSIGGRIHGAEGEGREPNMQAPRGDHYRPQVSPDCSPSDFSRDSLMRTSQRPNPPPRRNVPEPAARTFRTTPTDEQGTQPPARLGTHQQSPNIADRKKIAQVVSSPGEVQNRSQASPDQRQPNSHHADRRVWSTTERHDAKLEDTRGKNSSQESNSTNTSNKLAVPGMLKMEEQTGEGDNVKSARSRRREMAMLHADSLSSDPSDCVRPPPPKPHKHRKAKSNDGNKQHKTGDFSSSEDEMRSTTSCGDDLESVSMISEKAPSTGSGKYDGVSSTAINAKIKNFLAHPVAWSITSDGTHLKGHMILSRHLAREGKPAEKAVLGLRVIGGRMGSNGEYGAFVTEVKPGGIADVIGHLRKDDEVIDWNGRCLRGLTNEEATDIINEAKSDPMVELIVLRPYSKDNLPPVIVTEEESWQLRVRHWNDCTPSVTVTAPESPNLTRRLMSISHVSGKIQLKVAYDKQEEELIIAVLSASELPLVDGNQPPQTYCQICLLPCHNDSEKRITRPVARTREPEWKQSFTYRNVSALDFEQRSIEVTVWNLKKNGRSEFLGEVMIDLSSTKLSTEPLWYRLRDHEAASDSKQNGSSASPRGRNLGRADARLKDGRKGRSPGIGDMTEVEARQRMDEERYSSAGSSSPKPYQGQRRDGRQGPYNMHSSREDLRDPPPSMSHRRQLPQVPPGPTSQRGLSLPVMPPISLIPSYPHFGILLRNQIYRYTRYIEEAAIYDQRRDPHGGRHDERYQDRHARYMYSPTSGRYGHGSRSHSSERYYSDSRVSPDDDMFMSDTSEMSGFSMQSTQSERPNRSKKKLSEFTSQMESRSPGRRPGPSHALPPHMRNKEPHHEGSMSDSGIHPDRRMNTRMGTREYGGSNNHHDRRTHRLNKQTSKDSNDGSVCSVSSDSSNAKQVFAHLSSRIEGLKRASQAFPLNDHYPNNNIYNCDDMFDARRGSDVSNLSDLRRSSDTSMQSQMAMSCTSLESSLYEDDLARAQMSASGFRSPHQTDMNDNSVERLNQIGAHRRADPRRGLPVNEIVAAISNPAFRNPHASNSVAAPPTSHNSSFQNSYHDSGYQSSTSNHSSTGQAQQWSSFPFGHRPDMTHLNSSARNSLGSIQKAD
ncbi:regulating synaptic membrane exocytosis protein 2-like, partial [Watersipora subatra]|uniref:regulating synaptic membrane exocytosis protein 2-like n=1 Tax=Watersipora subatra TaxID=2589382 RepID=UPI00355B07DC